MELAGVDAGSKMLGVARGPSAKAVRQKKIVASRSQLLADRETHLRHFVSIVPYFLHHAGDGELGQQSERQSRSFQDAPEARF